MEKFVQDLFQGNPDLSTLTHGIVRKQYLAHIGKETLTKEEKEHLRRLIEKALLQIQIDDSGEEELLAISQPLAMARGQKRNLCVSDNSGDEVESKHEQKKQRTTKELELNSNEEDSGIDSKKAQVSHGPKPAGKSSSTSDHEDLVPEGPTGTSRSMRNKTAPPSHRTKREMLSSQYSKGQQGRRGGGSSGSESEESKEDQEGDVEEVVSKTRKATRAQAAESENDSEPNLKPRRLQKKKGRDREQKGPHKVDQSGCRRKDAQRGKKETESEEESELSETCGKKRTDGTDNEEERVKGGSCTAGIRREQSSWKTQGRSWSEDESDCASREKQRKVTGYNHRKKEMSVDESESDSEEPEDLGQLKKDVHRTKTQSRSAEKWKSDSDSEEEVLKKQVKKQEVKRAQGRGVSKKDQDGNWTCKNPVKNQGGQQPKRSGRKAESGSEAEDEKVSRPIKKGRWNASGSENKSQSEVEQRGKGKAVTDIDDSESSSEETLSVNQSGKRMVKGRAVIKEVSGSESSPEEDELKKKGTEKSQQGSVGKVGTESDSEDSGSKSVNRVKNKSTQKKGTQKISRNNSKEELRSGSDKEEECGCSEDEDGSRSGSESSPEEDELKKKGTEKSQQGSVGKVGTESDSEDSGSKSVNRVKKSTQKKGTQKPSRNNSKEELRSGSDKEEECGSSEDEDGARSSKQRQRGKDRQHDHPSIRRLKRYIRECGAYRNYKKLLMGCRSRKAQLEVLKQELENLGVKGMPNLAKCKALKKKREEAAEVASLDLGNIIATEGRPRRRNVWSLYSKPEEPTRSPEESPIRRCATDWSRLRGVISSDDESN